MINIEPSAKAVTSNSSLVISSRQRFKYLMILVLLLAFSIRMLVFSAMANDSEKFFQNDSVLYQKLAVNLHEFRQFGLLTEEGWGPHINRTPLYPGFLAIVYTVFGVQPAVAMLVQGLISTVTVALAYRLGQLWNGPRIGALVAILMSLEVVSIFYTSQLMTETLFSFFLLAGVVACSAMIQHRKWQYGLVSGMMLGLAALTRPLVFYLIPVIVVLSVLLYVGGKKQRVLGAFSIFLTFAIIITPWLTRNYNLTGRIVMSVNQAMYLKDSVSQMRAFQQGIPFRQAREELLEEVERETSEAVRRDPAKLAAYYERKFPAEILTNWRAYAFVHLRGSMLLFVVPAANVVARTLGWLHPGGGTGLLVNLANRSPLETWQAFQEFRSQLPQTDYGDWLFFGLVGYELVFLALINLGMILGFVKCLRTKRWRLLLFVVPIIGYLALVTGPIGFDARYRLPMMPFLILLTVQVLPWAIETSQKFEN